MTPFQKVVKLYEAWPADQLAEKIRRDEAAISTMQSGLAAMRKAQRIQKTITNGGKVPQHTREA